jgi:hypothetical protein
VAVAPEDPVCVDAEPLAAELAEEPLLLLPQAATKTLAPSTAAMPPTRYLVLLSRPIITLLTSWLSDRARVGSPSSTTTPERRDPS